MGNIGWIDTDTYSFDCMLRMERFQIRLMLEDASAHPEIGAALGAALKANPKAAWLWMQKCPEGAAAVTALVSSSPDAPTPEQVREAEKRVLARYEDFVIYTTPERVPERCDFVYGWDKKRLFEICDPEGKTVLDVGSGTGRLAFAAAEKAAFTVASEPVDALREFMRDEIARRGVKNMRVCDGLCDSLPFPENSFDVVMSGHVVGDRFREEVDEMTRVAKPGGWLLDVPGDQHREVGPNELLLSDGWEELPYAGTFGKITRRYRKRVMK